MGETFPTRRAPEEEVERDQPLCIGSQVLRVLHDPLVAFQLPDQVLYAHEIFKDLPDAYVGSVKTVKAGVDVLRLE